MLCNRNKIGSIAYENLIKFGAFGYLKKFISVNIKSKFVKKIRYII